MTGTADHDDRVMRFVTAALQKPTAERMTYLRLACAGNEDLYREVADAVTWEERMGGFLQHPMVAFKDPARAIHSGQVVSERFEITREIGEGGMGIVYEARDRKRGQKIALKFAKAGFQRLLSPELEGALKVRHPNICLVNEIHTATIDRCDVDFLTMEFVEGETLSKYLLKHSNLPQEVALDIARQLCAGLAEAHRSGIIHRDLKSGNVMICPTAGQGIRVVIMDFGLAGGLALDSVEGGTPGYMAPEVREGGKASCASDIYSLGVILYEMVTGQLPAQDKSANPGGPRRFLAPSSLKKGLDPRWDRVLQRCLDAAPARRPSDPRQIIGGLEKRPFRKTPLLVATALLLGVFAIPQVRERLSDRFWPPPSVRLAVLPLEGATDGAEIEPGVLQDVSDRVRRMSSSRRSVMVISPSELLDKRVQTAEQARRVLHATHALQTRVSRVGNEVVVQGSVLDLTTQTSLREIAGHYSGATIGTLPGALAGAVSVALGLLGSRAPEPLSPAATPAYDRGLYLLRRDQESFDEAIVSFSDAARIDPRSPLPLAGLIEAEVMRFVQTEQQAGLDRAWKDLEAAESLSPSSPRVRMAAGLLKTTAGQYEEALDDYRNVLENEPHNEQALRHIAEVYDKLKMPSRAIDAYQKAIKLDPGYYAGYHGLGVFYYYHGNYPAAAEQFQNSIDRAPGMFEEYTNLGASLSDLGRFAEAEQALLTSLKLHETARALNNLGVMRAYQKRDAEALESYERAIALDPSEYVYLENLADSERRVGRVHDADAAYRKAMDMALTALKQDPRKGYDRGFVAYIAARLGDRKRAEDEIAQALQLSRGETKVTRNAVLTYEVLGERDLALRLLDGAQPELVHELDRQPDLADFRQDSRFQQLVSKNSTGGK